MRYAFALALAVVFVAGCTQEQTTREANKFVTGGPEATADSLTYARENLSFKFESDLPHSDDVTMLIGTVTNKGPRTLVYVKAMVVLRDDAGQSHGGDEVFIAHKLPVGENRTPIKAGSSRQFTVKVKDVRPGYKLDKTQVTILEAATL